MNKLEKEKVISSIRIECVRQGLALLSQQAYVLATVHWETNRTFRPVREAYWLSDRWRKQNLSYYPYYARGYVGITWKSNYAKYSKLLNIDMVTDPDLALDHDFALFILVHGFRHGTFTGHRLDQHVNKAKTDFRGARRCINGTDRACEIASIAKMYLGQISICDETVYRLQVRLNELETKPALVCDGIFGPKTQKALIRLQKSLGITKYWKPDKRLDEALGFPYPELI